MSLKRNKDTTHLVGKFRVWGTQQPLGRGRLKSYWWVYLWGTREAMLGNVEEGTGKDTQAVCRSRDWKMCYGKRGMFPRQGPLVGELHFVRGDWNEDTVAHEAAHATLQLVKIGVIPLADLFDLQEPLLVEEMFCYNLGALTDQIHRGLVGLESVVG